MSRFTDHCIYTLTPEDFSRIKGLLRAVEEAIGEIVSYRCVRPLDPDGDFALEDAVYEQTSRVLKDCADKIDDIF